MKSSASKIQLTGFDDLFQAGGTSEVSGETVQEVPLSELFPFKNHPFQVRDDEAMQKSEMFLTIITVNSRVRGQFTCPILEKFFTSRRKASCTASSAS